MILYLKDESAKISLWFRLGTFLTEKNKWYLSPIILIIKVIYKHLQHKTGIQLPWGTHIGYGLRFFHFGSVVIAQSSNIGHNVSIHQDVTIGRVFNGGKAGVPTIGDNVVIFAGAKIIGNVTIGNDVVVGANAVVVDNVPDGCIVAGVPAKVISSSSNKCFNKEWGEIFAHGYEE